MLNFAAVFSDHCVLQRNKPIPVWGWTEPETFVRVTLGSEERFVISSPRGAFRVWFPPLETGGELELKAETARESVRISDITAGEVWLASGQSNMEFRISALDPAEPVEPEPRVRAFRLGLEAQVGGREDCTGKWVIADTSETIRPLSAVAYFFACKLARELNVTVGFIDNSWGGTEAESWCSREALLRNRDCRQAVLAYESSIHLRERWQLTPQTETPVKPAPLTPPPGTPIPPNKGEAELWHTPGLDDSDWGEMNLPGSWFEAGEIYNGVLWFRRSVILPESWLGRKIELHLGAIDKQDITYFNGHRVGATGQGFDLQYWATPRNYPVSPELADRRECGIAVRVFSFVLDGGMLGPARAMKLVCEGAEPETIPLRGLWKFKTECKMADSRTLPPEKRFANGDPHQPGVLFDSMVKPLIPCALRGVIWYQGESNEKTFDTYQSVMASLIDDWRRAWGEELPFHQVQLAGFHDAAPFDPDSIWARLREAQFQVAERTGNGLIVAFDLGEAQNIHPKRKRPVADRLSALVLADTYQRGNDSAHGPVLERATFGCDGNAELFFRNIGSGLTVESGATLFYLAGTNRRFYPAEPEIHGNRIVLQCPDVSIPASVRYAWADNPTGGILKNREGFPASPFRTDTWL